MTQAILAAFALLLLAAAPAAAQTPEPDAWPAPERTVTAHGLVSDADPAIRIALPEDATYVGAVRWPLYGVADAELHAFVEADETGLVRRFYWIQFEAYLPSRPDARYRYEESNPETVELSGYTVHVSPGFSGGPDFVPREGSDSEAFRGLLAEHGYRLPLWAASVRFVYLPTPDRRQELMIIYGENLDPTAGVISAAMGAGAEGVTWPELTGPLIARAQERIVLAPRSGE